MTALFKNLFLAVVTLSLIAGLNACVDQDFDEPPVGGEDPGITPNATISDVKALLVPGSLTEIKEDLVIRGVVVADDRAGNFFRSFILQDATGGIEVRIDQTNAYNFYPVGREIFIRCQGLVIGDFNGITQLGGYVFIENGAPQLGNIIALEDHLLRGVRVGEPEPTVKTIGTLAQADISTLIRLENVEFVSQDVGFPYADAIGRRTLNRTIIDCDGNEITLRTSGFAIFANEPIPGGNGSIIGIYSVFGTTQQLLIRDLTDVRMNDTRCSEGGGGGGSTGNEEAITIREIRDLFGNGTSRAPANSKISGVVISDVSTNNWVSRNLVLQDETAGIVIRFTGDHSFPLGQEIEVVVSGAELTEFNGLLQINNLPNNQASSPGAGTLPTPRETTIAELLANTEVWESTLIRISDATIQSGTYAGSKSVSDATGSIDMFTRSQASFAGQSVPGGSVNVTAIVSQFNSPQIIIRNPNDVAEGNGNSGGGGNGGGDPNGSLTTLNETFSGLSANQDVMLNNWTNVALRGSRRWRAGSFSGNTYAQATAFQDTEPAMETWLVTPPIDLSEEKVLSFRSAQAFFVHNGLSIWISTDYDGENIGNATWTELNCTLAGSGNNNYDWVESGDIDLSAYTGTAYIGFKYEGSGNVNTTTYRIDDIVVRNK